MAAKGRTELKHYITKSDYFLLRNRLKAVMNTDPHAGLDGTYIVRSVYFDNFDNKILQQKIIGLYKRDKYRIRLYNNDLQHINLEKKSKENNVCVKEKCSVSAEEYEKIRRDDIEWMAEDERDLIRELYMQMKLYQLKPINIVEYKREVFAYSYGNVRITFDSALKTSVRNNDLLNPRVHMVDSLDPRYVILELKYDEYLPDIIKDIAQIGNRRYLAVSKYVLSRLFG